MTKNRRNPYKKMDLEEIGTHIRALRESIKEARKENKPTGLFQSQLEQAKSAARRKLIKVRQGASLQDWIADVEYSQDIGRAKQNDTLSSQDCSNRGSN